MSRLPDRLPDRVDEHVDNHLFSGTDSPIGRDDSTAPTDASRADTHTAAHLGRLALGRLAELLSERELAVISSVAKYRYLTGHQIEQLHFRDHATADTAARIRRRILERLTAAKMLTRLPRAIGGVRAGSGAYVYALDTLGYRIVHGEARRSGAPRDGGPSTAFLAHTLAIAQLAVDLETTASRGDIESLTIETEPQCWRSFQIGLRGTDTLKPDLYAHVTTTEFEDSWFIEIDRGTESLTAVQKKCQCYLDYYRTGIEQQREGLFPRVLWSAPTAKRVGQIQASIARIPNVPDGLFLTVLDSAALSTIVGGAP